MLSIIPLLFLISSVSCLPFLNNEYFFNFSCTKPIQLELDLFQGSNPNLNQSTKNFGYIYRLDTPNLKLGPDMDINLSHQKNDLLPQAAAAVILTGLSYNEYNAKFVARGRISKLNSDRIKRVVPSTKGSIMTIRFDAFGFDHGKWYKSFSSTGGITGKVTHMNVVHQTGGEKYYQELVIELTPETSHQDEYLDFTASSLATTKHFHWSGKSSCRKRMVQKNKRDRFNEIIDSAVLL